jgi:hypothetical protein
VPAPVKHTAWRNDQAGIRAPCEWTIQKELAREREIDVPGKRRLPIDIAALAHAMDHADRSTQEYLLDTYTGELFVLPRAVLDAALDGTPTDSLPSDLREALPRAKIVARAKPGRFVVVPQRPPPDPFDVMQRFVASVRDGDLRRSLQRALGGHAPFRRFKEVLADDVAEEERWQSYGSAVRQIEAREWVEELSIEPVE